jgi:pyruvate dehydrogenase E2 component (dihydrolipoamide acetyltransferase)
MEEERGNLGVATDVVLPQSGLEVSEGTVVALDVAVGDRVAEGERLLEVETDKALSEVVAPSAGVVISVEVEVGDTIPVGATLVRLGEPDDAAAAAGQPSSAAAGQATEPAAAARPPLTVGAPAVASERRGAHRIRAAPIARRAALHLGVTLEELTGTGPRGRITLGDVERAAGDARPAQGGNGAGAERLEPLSATRRTVARRMTDSQRIPQFSLHRDVDAEWLLAEKGRLSADGPARIGVNDLLVQALAETVVRHPDLGASYVEHDGRPQLCRRDGVNVGLAVATERGLLVPVIARAHERSLAELALERARLVESARDGRLGGEDMRGASISLSSLASFGVDRFNAMLNPGESAILAVGRTTDRVVPRDRGFAVVPTMTLTMTVDHRVLDGAAGAAALAELAGLLEGGMTWRV